MKLSMTSLMLCTLLIAGTTATATKADWTQKFSFNEPFVQPWLVQALPAGPFVITTESVQFENALGALDGFVGILGSRSSPLPPAVSAAAFVSRETGRDITLGTVVNPDQRPVSGLLGGVVRYTTGTGFGIAGLVDYSSGNLTIARYDSIGGTFEVLASTTIANFGGTKPYGVLITAIGTIVTARAYDMLASDLFNSFQTSALVASVAAVDETTSGIAGLLSRSADPTQPTQGTFGTVFLETVDKQSDAEGNSVDDIFWTLPDGSVYAGPINGTGNYIGQAPPSWKLRSTADFNDDALADLVWHNSVTGESGIWLSTYQVTIGNAVPGYVWTPLPGLPAADWELVGVGELTEDGMPDIVWRNQNDNMLWLWEMNRTAIDRAYPFFAIPGSWQMQTIADFDRDGDDDLFFRDVEGNNGIVLMDDTTPTDWRPLPFVAGDWEVFGALNVLNPLDLIVSDPSAPSPPPPNFSNDLLWRNRASGKIVIWDMNLTTYTNFYEIRQTSPQWLVRN